MKSNQERRKSLKCKGERNFLIVSVISAIIRLIEGKKGKKYNYIRDFSDVETLPIVGKYIRPREYKDKDEEQLTNKLKVTFVDDICPGRGRSDPKYQDMHWGSTTGLLKGTLTIDKIASLPEKFRVGLFKHDRDYKVFCRMNHLFDDSPTISINRLSLKLEYPCPVPNEYAAGGFAHELDLLLSEGLPPDEGGDGQGFFFRDGRQLLMLNHMKGGLSAAVAVLVNKANVPQVKKRKKKIFGNSVDQLYEGGQARKSWAGKHYYSAGPYALGDGLMKFSLAPHEPDDLGRELAPDLDNPTDVHLAKSEELVSRDRKVCFDLCVQIATVDSIPEPKEGDPPKDVMAVEYTDLVWDNQKAPFIKVGTLEMEVISTDHSEAEKHWYAVSFNAWNTLHCMRPMGQLFRARREVHRYYREQRMKRSFETDAKPKCPFH